MHIRAYITLARPKHWLKNLLIFLPLLYARNLANPDLLMLTAMCFVVFCFISSGVYIVNDIIDVEKDRQHPIKNTRPIASGIVEISEAVVFALFLFVLGFSVAILGWSNYLVALFALSYILLNLAYSFFLKHYAIVDCFCIAAGFTLRIYAGSAASNDRITEWLFLTMIAVSLFMAFGKRRGEMMLVADVVMTRKVLASYDLQFLNGAVFACAGLTIVFYSLWAVTSVSAMIYTVPLVIFIICKYLLVVHNCNSFGDPTSVILGDKTLLVTIGIFGLLSTILLYY